ncbi:MAG: alpha/beta hydrolase [bacterium]
MDDCQENKGEKALIRGVETHYKVLGQGRAVLVLHGWGASPDSWQSVQEILSGQGFKVICPDFPGFGQSETPTRAWSLNDYLAWLIEFIDFLKLEKPIVVGHSFGGRVAIRLSVAHPDIINKLILIGSAGIKPELSLKQAMILKMAKLGRTLFPSEKLRSAARRVFYSFLRHKDYVNAKPVMRKTMQNVLAEDLSSLLPQIQTETLLVWGEKDRMVPLQFARIFAKEIKGSELKIIPGVGHSPQREVPQQTAAIILEFLKP